MREQYASDPDFRRRADDAVRHVIAAKIKLYPQLQLAQVLVDPASPRPRHRRQGGDEMRYARRGCADAPPAARPSPSCAARLPRGPVTPDKVLDRRVLGGLLPVPRHAEARAAGRAARALRAGRQSARSSPTTSPPSASASSTPGSRTRPIRRTQRPRRRSPTRRGSSSRSRSTTRSARPSPAPRSGSSTRRPSTCATRTSIGIAYNVPYHLDSTEVSKLSAYFAVYSKTRRGDRDGLPRAVRRRHAAGPRARQRQRHLLQRRRRGAAGPVAADQRRRLRPAARRA